MDVITPYTLPTNSMSVKAHMVPANIEIALIAAIATFRLILFITVEMLLVLRRVLSFVDDVIANASSCSSCKIAGTVIAVNYRWKMSVVRKTGGIDPNLSKTGGGVIYNLSFLYI